MKRPTLAQWLAQLSEFLPAAYVFAYAAQIEALYADGATPGEAAIYCHAYLAGPYLAEPGRVFAPPIGDQP